MQVLAVYSRSNGYVPDIVRFRLESDSTAICVGLWLAPELDMCILDRCIWFVDR